MSSDDETVHISFNGAIYNFVEVRRELQSMGISFISNSDTEVMLRAYEAWGAEFVYRLEGMYAFAIWNSRDRTLLIGRDPFGEKPLFYAHAGDSFGFASEPQALLGFLGSTKIRSSAVLNHLLFRYSPSGIPFFEGVDQLPPSSLGVYRNGEFKIVPLGEHFKEQHFAGPAERLEALQSALSESLRLRLRADVPIGIFLSGGIDSAGLAAISAPLSANQIHSYTIDFQGGGEAYSERDKAHSIAQMTGLQHHVVQIGEEDFVAGLELATVRRGAPLGEYNDVAMLRLAQAARANVKVVLCGEGADELFGGYPRYWGERYVATAQRFIPHGLANLIGAVGSQKVSSGKMATMLRAFACNNFVERQAAWFATMSLLEVRSLAPDLAREYDPFANLSERYEALKKELPPVRAAMLFDQSVWLPENLLARGDRMTMAAPIEMRMPYLDRKVVEIARSAPCSTIHEGREGKQLLRKALSSILPAEVTARRKHGFKTPFREWMGGPLRSFIGDHLLAGTPLVTSFVDRNQMTSLVERYFGGDDNNERTVWGLLSLEVFLRSLPVAVPLK